MTDKEMAQYKQRCRERWQRAIAAMNSWRPGGPTWSPKFTEKQQQEHDEYVKRHNLPF